MMKTAVPWVRMLTSAAAWALLVAQVCNNWGTHVLMTSLPKYMADVLKFDIKSASIPYRRRCTL